MFGLHPAAPVDSFDPELEEERSARGNADRQCGRLRSLLVFAPVAIATWKGPRYTFESANDAYLHLFQRGRDILGKTFAEAFPELPPDDTSFGIFDEVYRTGEPHAEPERRVTIMLDGEKRERFYTFTVVATREDGRVDGLMASLVDVTEPVLAREMLKWERDRAAALATSERVSRGRAEQARDRSDFLLGVANSLGEGLELEKILERLVGTIAPAQADFASVWLADGTRAIRRMVHAPQDQPIVPYRESKRYPPTFPIQQVADSGIPLLINDLPRRMEGLDFPEYKQLAFQYGAYVPIKRGERVAAVLTVANHKGREFGANDVAVFQAVAHQAALAFENARLFAETAQLRREAERATLAKDHFLARVSHDLRNPLGSILGWASLLRSSRAGPSELAKGLEVIERNAKAQVQLVEDLLDLSRISSGKMKLEISSLPVYEALDTALDPARLAAEAKRVSLQVTVERDVGVIAVDPERFRQVVWNLVSNAVKFTPAGGRVRVDARREASRFRLVVSDNGRGISAEFLPHVFETFEQADDGVRRTGGLGLGLAIVRHIVELHGGTVEVASEGEGKGAEFRVTLPIRTATRPADAVAVRVCDRSKNVLEGATILAVDDEEDAREVVAAILRHAGAEVRAAGSAEEAFARFREERPSAVVSDVGMPGRDGKSLLRQLRALREDEGGRVPAVALTALTHAQDRIDVLSAGFNTHVSKPVEPRELVLVIAGLLGREIPLT